MKLFKIQHLFIAVTLISVLAACHKKDDATPDTPTAQRAGVYVLNQGNFGGSNGTLTYYDYTTKKLTADIFNTVNAKGLGDTPNDVKIYGSKMYIAVDVSGQIQVLDAKTAKILKTFDQKTSGVSREPRSIAFNKNKAFISQYDGTIAVLDTATLTIDKYITVGRNPEQMVVSNGKLYVANSGGLTFGNPDKTVSVVDLTSLTETKKITVIANPGSIAADGYGNVYVFSSGDYATVKAGLTVIDNTTDVVKSQTNAITGSYGTPIVINGDVAYFLTTDSKGANIVGVYNVKTQTLGTTNFITDGTVITTPYSLAYDSLTGELFVTDAKDYSSNGAMFAFDKNGKKEYSIVTGISPGAIAFVNK
jgi:YVTN family beta-propeller protein